MQNKNLYELSGAFGFSLIAVPLGSALAAIVLSVAYAYCVVFSPVATYYSILYSIGLGYGVAYCVKFITRFSHCRNMRFARSFGAIAGLFTIYASWAMFVQVLSMRDISNFELTKVQVFCDPGFVWLSAKSIAAEGWHTPFWSLKPSGGILWLIWVLEAFLIFAITWEYSQSSLVDRVYCELCQRWTVREKGILRVGTPRTVRKNREMLPENLKTPLFFPEFDGNAQEHVRYDVHSCPSCRHFFVVSAKALMFSRGEDGRFEKNGIELGPPCVVHQDIVDALSNWRRPDVHALDESDELMSGDSH